MRCHVPPEAEGLTLGRYLYDRLKLSRTLLRRAKQCGGLLVDGQSVRTNHPLTGGELVEVRVEQEGRVHPEPMDLRILYEDAYLLAVDKPAGMVVHPVRDYQSGTLANGVAQHLLDRGGAPIVRPVQRLDRETSGLILFAKDPAVAGRMAGELERHKLERRYIAFVEGRVEPGCGSVTVPIRRVWGHPVAREPAMGPRTPEQEQLLASAEASGQVLRAEWKGSGQSAVTHWEVLRRCAGATMMALRLETGRTHQIRIHMTYMGHPLLGDGLYGGGGSPGRQALHAESLAFLHPVSGQLIRLEAPLPDDLMSLMDQLNCGGG